MTQEARREEALFVRLLCDVMIPAELAEARLLPLEVQQDDDALLQEAARQQRAVVTCNYSDPGATSASFMSSGRLRARSTPASSWCLSIRSAAVRTAGKCVTA